jgi:hypothetical protein
MRSEKIYEYDLDIKGVTDYGVSMDAILSGKEKVHYRGLASTSRLRDAVRVAWRAERAASITCGCAPTAVSTLTSTRPSKLTTATGSP